MTLPLRPELKEASARLQKLYLEGGLPAVSTFLAKAPKRTIASEARGYILNPKNRGISFYWKPEDGHSAVTSLVATGHYEAIESEVLMLLAQESRLIFDIGANVGYYSVLLASLSNFNGRIVGFEPGVEALEELRANIQLNGLQDRVTVYPFAVSNESGRVAIWTPIGIGSSAASFKKLHEGAQQKTECESITLDEICGEHVDWSESLDLIKLDVEGAELKVLQGALRTILRNFPTIFVELLRKWSSPFGYSPNDVMKMLISHGYECWAFNDGLEHTASITDKTNATNFIFIHNSERRQTHRTVLKQFLL
jgi:FkbM family methyltransferase